MKLKTLGSRLQSVPSKLRALPPPEPTTERLRGGAAMKRSERLRSRDPMCVQCRAEGVVEIAMEWDHIVPLWEGGRDSEANIQGLCIAHHAAKTAAEAKRRAALKR